MREAIAEPLSGQAVFFFFFPSGNVRVDCLSERKPCRDDAVDGVATERGMARATEGFGHRPQNPPALALGRIRVPARAAYRSSP